MNPDLNDPQIATQAQNLTKAIFQHESGMDYNATGDAGTSFGAGQWQKGTWQSQAGDILGDPNAPMTKDNQSVVAQGTIRKLISQGKDAAQIAAIWNSGSDENWQNSIGTRTINGQQIAYNVPQYVKNVTDLYQQYKNESSTPTTQSTTPSAGAQVLGQSGSTQSSTPDINAPYDVSTPSTPTTQPTTPTEQPDKPGILSQSINQFGKGYGEISQGTQSGDIGLMGRGVLNEAAGGIRAVFSPVEWAFNKAKDLVEKIPGVKQVFGATQDGIQKAANVISDNPLIQKFAIQNPHAEEVLGNLMTIAGTMIPGEENASGAIQASKDAIGETASKIVEPIKQNLENKYVTDTINDWDKIGGDYTKTAKILDQDESRMANGNLPDSYKPTTQFLGELGINPKSLIDNNKFNTSEISDKLMGDSVKPFENTLTKQLKVAQQSQPPVSIDELRNTIVNKIDSIKGVVPEDQASMINSAHNAIDAIANKFPNGVPLDELNILKGNYWKKTKFDLLKPLQPQVNYNIGSAMKDIIESKSGDANVRELNGLLGNYYKAGKFLNGLDTKVPKLTGTQKLVRGVVKGAAVVGGEKLFGLSGGIGGFILGKSISHVLENASNPLKSLILKNLEKESPKAYTEALTWLGKKEAERLQRLALPAPSIPGSSENPIRLPSAPLGRTMSRSGE